MPETPKSTKSLKKALFLDRDGVVINYIPYLSRPEQVQIPEGAGKALQYWKNRDYLLILITNQSGVGRGRFTLEDVESVHERVRQIYQPFGVEFDDIFLCPHHPDDNCQCRKPSGEMLIKAAEKHGISLADSFFLGDAPSDLEAAIAAGCQPVLVLTGRGQTTFKEIDQYPVEILVFDQIADTLILLNNDPN